MATEGPADDDIDVLKSIACNAAAAELSVDADLELAKVLQEQENAWARQAGIYLEEAGAENVQPEHLLFGDEAEAAGLEASAGEAGSEEGDPPAHEAAGVGDAEGGAVAGEPAAPANLAQWQQGMGDYAESEYSDEGWDDDDIDPDTMTYEQILEVTDVVGVVRVGLPADVEAALPVMDFSSARETVGRPRRDGAQEPIMGLDKCMVCLEDYEPGEDVIRLPCCHLYHPGCISAWFKAKKTCPLCLKEVDVGGSPTKPLPGTASPEPPMDSPDDGCVPMDED